MMVEIKKKGDYLHAYENGVKMGTLNLKTDRFFGATRVWEALRKKADTQAVEQMRKAMAKIAAEKVIS